jgi:ferrous iron transport protein A
MPFVRLSVSPPVADRGRLRAPLGIRGAPVISRIWRARRAQETGPRPLSSLRPGQHGLVVRIAGTSPERVVRLSSLGVMPGVRVTLVQTTPAVVLRVAETSIALDRDVADDILVDGVHVDSGP